jgi:hypothetical protein
LWFVLGLRHSFATIGADDQHIETREQVMISIFNDILFDDCTEQWLVMGKSGLVLGRYTSFAQAVALTRKLNNLVAGLNTAMKRKPH